MQILLSTFNGETYLNELLNSLLAQSFNDVSISIRDDGSTDKTIGIVQKFVEEHPSAELVLGENIGVSKSYFRLLQEKPDRVFYSFCDQDDVWAVDKIKRAVEKLSSVGHETPALYFSRLEYVNHDLKHLGYSRKPERCITFANALVENIASGCTIVLNQSARNLIVSRIPSHCIMHDWWCLLVVSALGTVIYDDHSAIQYRMHGDNTVGAPLSLSHEITSRIKRFSTDYVVSNWVHAQAKEFQSLYGEILPDDKSLILGRFIDSRRTFISRLKFLLRSSVYRQKKIDDYILKVLILLNRY